MSKSEEKNTQTTKTDLSPYIVNVQGKDFITFPGLLREAHALGLKEIKTELISSPSDLSNPVVKATVILVEDNAVMSKVFSGYGDANVNNVAKKVSGALLRMAETRAIARALRFACNIDMAALEELDAEENVISGNSAPSRSTFLKSKVSEPVTPETSEPLNTLSVSNVSNTVEATPAAPTSKPTFSARKKFSAGGQ